MPYIRCSIRPSHLDLMSRDTASQSSASARSRRTADPRPTLRRSLSSSSGAVGEPLLFRDSVGVRVSLLPMIAAECHPACSRFPSPLTPSLAIAHIVTVLSARCSHLQLRRACSRLSAGQVHMVQQHLNTQIFGRIHKKKSFSQKPSDDRSLRRSGIHPPIIKSSYSANIKEDCSYFINKMAYYGDFPSR